MLSIEKISKKFVDFHLKDLDFKVGKNEYFVLLGPSGSGKSLTLDIIAGLQKCDSGNIYLNKKNITHQKIQDRKIGIVFQDNALFPHLSVYENIAYPLYYNKLSQKKKNAIINELAEELEIINLLKRKPPTLSGGEKQRVALARALALKPLLLLLDEPLSSLDVILKNDIRTLLRKINKNGQTIIHVTHDYEEAIILSSKVGIINNGILEHCDKPEEVFLKPKSAFVALLTGAKNFFPINLIKNDNFTDIAIVSEDIKVIINKETKSDKGWIIVRGEDIVISKQYQELSSNNQFKGIITEILPTIRGLELIINAGKKWSVLITRESLSRLNLEINSEVWLSFKTASVIFIPE